FGVRAMIEGFVNGPAGGSTAGNGHSTNGATPASGVKPSGDAVGALFSQLGTLIQPALARVTGDGAKATPEMSEQVARSLAENPAFLAALQDALKPAQPVPPTQAIVVESAEPAKS